MSDKQFEDMARGLGSDERRATMPDVRFLKAFRFLVRIGGKTVGAARCSTLDTWADRHGNWKCKPVALESAPREGEPGLAAYRGRHSLGDIYLVDLLPDGKPARVFKLTGCRVRRFESYTRDGMDDSVVMERLTVLPRRIHLRWSLAETEEDRQESKQRMKTMMRRRLSAGGRRGKVQDHSQAPR